MRPWKGRLRCLQGFTSGAERIEGTLSCVLGYTSTQGVGAFQIGPRGEPCNRQNTGSLKNEPNWMPSWHPDV